MGEKNQYSKKEAISLINKKTGKKKISIFFDIIKCANKYKSNPKDYIVFEMYKLNDKQRATIITNGINNKLIKKNNNDTTVFDNKIDFNKKFHKYLLRDWLSLNDYNEFIDFTKKHSTIIAKTANHDSEVEEITINEKNSKKIYNKLQEEQKVLIEEKATQCKELASLNPSSLNTMKIITINNKIVAAYLIVGNSKDINNQNKEKELIAPINIETGIIDYPATNNEGKVFERHPITSELILWFQIPKWPRIVRYIERISREVSDANYICWNICLGEKDPFIISATAKPNHYLYQLPAHRANDTGLLPIFEEAMNRKEENEDENSYSN